MNKTYLFIRAEGFYALEFEIPEGHTEYEVLADMAELNPGTLKVLDISMTKILWP